MKLVVNGADVEVDDRHAKTPLLWVLRDVLGLRGTKFGCGAGFCAACTVLIDGRNTKSCQTATERAVGQGRHDGRGSLGPRRRRGPRRVAPRQRRAVRLLPARADAGRGVAARVRPVAGRREDRRVDEREPVPLRHLSADPGRDPRGRRARWPQATDPAPLVAPPEPEVRRLTPEEMADPVHPYIRIRADGTVVAYSSQIEMGQGIHTGLATIVAEELDADFDSVRVVNAANGGGPERRRLRKPRRSAARFQLTGASNSTKGFWVRYRLAAAQARARLVAAAAEAWDVPAAEVEVERGVVRHRERQAGDVRRAGRAGRAAAGSRRRAAQGPGRLQADRARGAAARRRRAEDPRRHPFHDRRRASPGC